MWIFKILSSNSFIVVFYFSLSIKSNLFSNIAIQTLAKSFSNNNFLYSSKESSGLLLSITKIIA